MNRKKLNKVLAIMLVFAIINSYFAVIADYIGKSYAASINYEKQETSVKKTDVIFDAYFKEGTKAQAVIWHHIDLCYECLQEMRKSFMEHEEGGYDVR